MQEYLLKASLEDLNLRLDLFILNFSQQHNLGFSRTFIQGLVREKKVLINNTCVIKPNYKIKAQDEVKVCVEKKAELDSPLPENIPLEIIYEDEDVAVINKQIGLVTHPAPGNYKHTLVNALIYNFQKLSDINPQRPGIVHRLDKETSGLMVIAKNNAAHLHLTQQFAKHTIKRKYVALVRGVMEFDENIIEMPIGRHPLKRKNMAVSFGKKTKYAKTLYRVLRRGNSFTLLELEPFTGRTHQLRVHLAFLGHPILGDTKYGKNNEFKRLALHAKSLGFVHPRSGKILEFSYDAPVDFIDVFNAGGADSKAGQKKKMTSGNSSVHQNKT